MLEMRKVHCVDMCKKFQVNFFPTECNLRGLSTLCKLHGIETFKNVHRKAKLCQQLAVRTIF